MAIDAQTLINRSAANGYWKLSDRSLREAIVVAAAATAPPSPVNEWVNRVMVNGGASPSAGTIAAMNTFVAALQSAGIWNSMRTLNCFVPDNLIASITPLVKTYGSDPWTNHGFVGSDLSTAGLQGDGIAKYLDTGFNPSTMFAAYTNAGMSICIPNNTGSGAIQLGCQFNIGVTAEIWTTATGLAGAMWNGTAPGVGLATFIIGSLQNMFASMDRNDPTAKGQLCYANTASGFQNPTNLVANTSTVMPNFNCFVFGLNRNGALNGASNSGISFVAFHDAFTVAQETSLYNAVQSLRTSLGGGTV